MPTYIQPSFSKGELSPDLHGRVDIAAYGNGLKKASNVIIHSTGGVSNRFGLRYIGPVKNYTSEIRLIPFKFKTADQYVLEFGDQYMRVIRNNGHVLQNPVSISAVTNANPGVLTTTSAHGFSNGDEVYVSDVGGMTELNTNRYVIVNATSTTFEMEDRITETLLDTSSFGSYTSGGTVSRVFTLTTPYLSEDLDRLKYTQSADTMTLVHPSYDPRDLVRTDHDDWTLSVINFGPEIDTPTNLSISNEGTGGSTTYDYRVSAIADETFEESIPADVQTTTGNATLDSTNFNRITWDAVTDAQRYAVYKLDNGLYGLIGETETEQFDDEGITPDKEASPPSLRDPLTGVDNRPGTTTYFEQRQVYGGSFNKPDTSHYSQIGNRLNFNFSTPFQDDDAIQATLTSLQVNEIRHMVPLNDLLVFTSGQEWRVNSGSDSRFSATTIKQKPQSSYGSSHLRPFVLGNSVIFVEESNAQVRTFGFSLAQDSYTSQDLTILSRHLLEEHILVDWGFAHARDPRIYMVRDDGMGLTATLDLEQKVIAWTTFHTDGKFKNVVVLRHADNEVEDTVYFVVERTISGKTVKYIEYSASRIFEDVRDCFFVDSGLSLDSPIDITGVSLTDPVVIIAPGHGFSDGDEVDISDIGWEPDIDEFFGESQPNQLNLNRFEVSNSTMNTFEILDVDSGTGIDGTAFNAYVSDGKVRKRVSSVSGLNHLEGETVVALVNGNVVTDLTVTDATITLPYAGSRIHVGLRYVADVQTLPPKELLLSKKAKMPKVNFYLKKSRGLFAGIESDDLSEIKQREFELVGAPTDLLTGHIEKIIPGNWTVNGSVYVRQVDPLPMTILAIIPDIEVEKI